MNSSPFFNVNGLGQNLTDLIISGYSSFRAGANAPGVGTIMELPPPERFWFSMTRYSSSAFSKCLS